ncbi:type II toxin-antitoxin system VapC family toxin [Phytoactinopolyspora alkaliphila]|uniref:Type II toxin-antitoxin system VapC family toxin n=1 Tax=Phytoactinopolyspora alkaliphila TaxID=1783498 RepID=A0A6N9YNX0_9ACTN|nr:PIN domain-containing protein [Phytoactinopolyspora alkaliphila]NED96529.1 type II toxin-antitoxin system VapC family toxin [Phytoactinopolyspora alkaliphila]
MAVLLDAYAAIAVLKGEPAAQEVRPVLERGEAVIHPLNLGEVIDRMSRLAGADPDDVEADIALLGVNTVQLDEATLVDSGRWRARHYHRTDRAVSLADCVAGLCAVTLKLVLATSDWHCAEMVRDEGGEVMPLPDSQGVRP